MKDTSNHRNGRAPGTEHHPQELLGKVQNFGTRSVLCHQQPSRESFFGFMEPVASGELTEVQNLFLHKLQGSVTNFFATPEDTDKIGKRDA
jgi:hypothetical protein